MRALLPLAAAVAAVALALAATGAAAPKRSIAITGVTESAGVVTVTVKITGWGMQPRRIGKAKSPAGGHWHLFVDGRYDGFSAHPTRGRTRNLAPGRHTIRVELANNDHTPLKPPVRSRSVTVNVAAPEPGEDPGEEEPDLGY